MKTFRSNGKLLLTGEYVVLDGGKALALPTVFGQSLTVEENNANTLAWKSYDQKGNIWFEYKFDISLLNTVTEQRIENPVNRLRQIINVAKKLNPSFLDTNQGYNVSTYLEFNRKWGLGTSSTLINNIANWAQVDAYSLLDKTFGGSGYDIACAQNSNPIKYQLLNSRKRTVETVEFFPEFINNLYFVYLNQKQNSRDGIKAYKSLNRIDEGILSAINSITDSIIECKSLYDFERLIVEHEKIISNLIQKKTVKSKLFTDYSGEIKSLGAWGGDFVMATSKDDPTEYFKSKGFETVIPYIDIVK